MKKEIRRKIRNSKKLAWRKFISKNTAWSKPYKIAILDKTNTQTSLPVETLLISKFPQNSSSQENSLLQKNDASSAQFKHFEDPDEIVTINEVAEHLKSNRNRSAPRIYQINYKLLKIFNKEFPNVLATLFTGCLQIGTFLECWKRGKVIWLWKPNKNSESSCSYCPITLLSTVGKTLEKAINSILQAHIKIRKILSNRQYGFCENKSTIDAIHTTLEAIQTYRNIAYYTATVTVNIRGTFDNLNWCHLFNELLNYKFPNYIIETIKNYTKNRNIISGEAESILTKGCSQGSILGPTLWNLGYNYVLNEMAKQGM